MRTELRDGLLELCLEEPPCNEIGSRMLDGLEAFAGRLGGARAVLVYSALPAGFCAGADLRELYREGLALPVEERVERVHRFLERIHRVLELLDSCPAPVVAAVHGICFGGGLELALCADLVVADKSARFAFPELRLGLIPGFGGIPRLRRDVGNAVVRDLLLTGRSLNATRAHECGLVGQLVGEGSALRAARAAAQQMLKFDPLTLSTAKRWIKPLPRAELGDEIATFLRLFRRPEVQENLRRFVENEGPLPYLP